MSQKADALREFIDGISDNFHKNILINEKTDLEALSQHLINFVTTDDKKIRLDAMDTIFKNFNPIPCLGIRVLPHGDATIYLGLLNNKESYRAIYTLPYRKLNSDSFEYVLTFNEKTPA